MERCRNQLAFEKEKFVNFGLATTFGTSNMIPATLIDNQTLHSILLAQVILETLTDVTVPPAPQAKNFTYRANAKEMVTWDLNKKNAELMKALEEQTGVNLDHYHELNIEYKWT